MTAREANYDENLVPEYVLPDPLTSLDGTRVADAEAWKGSRRQEVLSLFTHHVYGRGPERPAQMEATSIEIEPDALGGRAVRKQVTVRLGPSPGAPEMEILMYLPAQHSEPVPAFVGLNFNGNHTIHADPAIKLSTRWIRDNPEHGVVDHRATEAARGTVADRWPVERILERGYGLATVYCGDLDPDYDDGYQNGVHPLSYTGEQTCPRPNEWGAIGAWAWGLSRALDYLESDDDVDDARVAVMGLSRLGKTALWTGAMDERFAAVISTNSGCGGAALSRRRFGETVEIINTAFPHWFCGNFKQYNGREDELPVDQHMLVALAAPRPVYVSSSEEDLWADPRGEFLAALHADPVYRLLGTEGLRATHMPGVNQPIGGSIGYHIRPGKHGITLYDWEQYMDFTDRHLEAQGLKSAR